MPPLKSQNEFLQYLAENKDSEDPSGRLPPLSELSQTLGISVARLREQMEIARALGFVEVRPRTGIRRLPYTFYPAVKQSLFYALEIDRSFFSAFSELRNRLEAAYWYESVSRLTAQDHQCLRELMTSAWDKLRSPQITIPQNEHKELHLRIYSRLENPFVQGILRAYWEAYEAVGLNQYAGYEYLQRVWEYHQTMVDSICSGDFVLGYQALIDHNDLLYHRPMENLPGESNTVLPQTDRLRWATLE